MSTAALRDEALSGSPTLELFASSHSLAPFVFFDITFAFDFNRLPNSATQVSSAASQGNRQDLRHPAHPLDNL